ncbi:MAG: hypothetical protein NTX50_20985 [Candidatus Sumerlaeota bacterium]|nr:hypothetical protein [Candidatus Sumerlaeota bacterium]
MKSVETAQYQHVPDWLARRYPAIAALEDNPLYLALTGRRYCRRWLRLWRRRKHWLGMNSQAKYLYPLAVVFCLIPPLAIIGIILLIIAGHRTQNLAVSFRQESKTGRMMDLYLSLTPEQMADGYAAARLIPGRWGAYIFMILMGLISLGCMIFAFSPWGYNKKEAFIILSAAPCIVCILTPMIFMENILIAYRTIARGARDAADPSLLARTKKALQIR